jgi:hypothetical protein
VFYIALFIIYDTHMKKTYYTLPMRINPGWRLPQFTRIEEDVVRGRIGTDVPRWDYCDDVPPHVAFANLGYARKRPVPAAAKKFSADLRKRFRLPARDLLLNPGNASVAEIRDFIKRYGVIGTMSSSAEPLESGEEFEVPALVFGYMQDRFRWRWQSAEKGSDVWFPEGFENTDSYPIPINCGRNAFELYPKDLFTFMQFLLARDLDEKTAGFCANPDCVTPFFVGRKGKECCSRRCASDRCVKRWRKNAARKSR